MAKASGLGARLFVGGYDISGDVGAVQTIRSSRNVDDVTGLDKGAHERLLLLRDGELQFNCFFNPTNIAGGGATDQEHVALKSLPTTDRVAMYFHSTTLGDPVAALIGKQVNYDWTRGAEGSLRGTVQALSDGYGLEWCQSLTAGKRTDTGATNGASVDYGAVSTLFGLSAYLEVFSFVGADATVKLQDSADNITFADIAGAAFTQITAAPAQQRIETGLTATVRRYVQAVTVTAGGFTSLVFAAAFNRYLTALS